MDTPSPDMKRVWELYEHAESVLAGRFNWGMLAQSMLLVAFITLFISSRPTLFDHVIALAVELAIIWAGVVACVVSYTRCLSVTKKIRHLQNRYLCPLDPLFREYMDVVPERALKKHEQHHAFVAVGLTWTVCILGAVATFVNRAWFAGGALTS